MVPSVLNNVHTASVTAESSEAPSDFSDAPNASGNGFMQLLGNLLGQQPAITEAHLETLAENPIDVLSETFDFGSLSDAELSEMLPEVLMLLGQYQQSGGSGNPSSEIVTDAASFNENESVTRSKVIWQPFSFDEKGKPLQHLISGKGPLKQDLQGLLKHLKKALPESDFKALLHDLKSIGITLKQTTKTQTVPLACEKIKALPFLNPSTIVPKDTSQLEATEPLPRFMSNETRLENTADESALSTETISTLSAQNGLEKVGLLLAPQDKSDSKALAIGELNRVDLIQPIQQAMQDKRQEIVIQLEPKELGSLTIKLASTQVGSEVEISARLIVDNIDAKKQLEGQLNELKQDLANNGTRVEKLDIVMVNKGEHNAMGNRSEQHNTKQNETFQNFQQQLKHGAFENSAQQQGQRDTRNNRQNNITPSNYDVADMGEVLSTTDAQNTVAWHDGRINLSI